MKKQKFITALLLLLVFFPASHLLAEVVRHEFSGTITALRFSSDNPLEGQVEVGDSFSGFYEFDASQPPFSGDACQVDLLQCYWEYIIPPNQYAISVGPFNVAASQEYEIYINNGNIDSGIPYDSYSVSNPDKIDLNGWLVNIVLVLKDETRTAITDPQLLFLEPPNPDDFASNRNQHFQIFASGTGSSDFVNGRLDRFVQVTIVAIDIMPRTCPNPCPLKGGGSIPVAILGTVDLDVNDIDPASVRLQGVAPFRSEIKDKATPVSIPLEECVCTTDGRDGFNDLCLKFDKREILNALGSVNVGDEIPLTLTGELYDDTPIVGQDCILIVEKKGKRD